MDSKVDLTERHGPHIAQGTPPSPILVYAGRNGLRDRFEQPASVSELDRGRRVGVALFSLPVPGTSYRLPEHRALLSPPPGARPSSAGAASLFDVRGRGPKRRSVLVRSPMAHSKPCSDAGPAPSRSGPRERPERHLARPALYRAGHRRSPRIARSRHRDHVSQVEESIAGLPFEASGPVRGCARGEGGEPEAAYPAHPRGPALLLSSRPGHGGANERFRPLFRNPRGHGDGAQPHCQINRGGGGALHHSYSPRRPWL